MSRYYRQRQRTDEQKDAIAKLILIGLLFCGYWIFTNFGKVALLGFCAIAIFIIYKRYKKRNNTSISSNNIWAEYPITSTQEISQEKTPYQKKEYLVTIAEKKIYEVLKPIADQNNWTVQIKVRLEDLVRVPNYTANHLKWRGHIRSRHIDFVLCDKAMRPLLAIELDDSSHMREDRKEIDDFKDQALRDAGLPLLRFSTQNFYNADEIASKISALLH